MSTNLAADELQIAIANAIRYFDGCNEPHALLWLQVMHRRFGIPAFAGALQRYDEALSAQANDLRLLRVFRRIADFDNPIAVEDLEAVTHLSDRIIVSALYCDRLGLPPSFPQVLEKALHAGGYYLTHALLAVVWIRALGVHLPVPEGFVDELFRANAALVNEDPRAVNDLKLEAAAFLHLAGQGSQVDDAFVTSVIATQNDDGGWGPRAAGARSDWHATILALLLLLHVRASGRAART